MTHGLRLSLIGIFAILIMQVPAQGSEPKIGEPDRGSQPNSSNTGIWKSYAPKGLKGEFNNYDPIGLIAGERIHTDCSINYTDPDTRKTYCFNSATSLTYFEHWPKTYARRAADALNKIEAAIPTH